MRFTDLSETALRSRFLRIRSALNTNVDCTTCQSMLWKEKSPLRLMDQATATEADMTTKKTAEHQAIKFGLTYNDAMREAMTVAARAARRHHKWVCCSSDKDDLLAAAYEGILLAWRAWRGPEVSAWSYTAWIYAELYSRREANRRKSVVSTGSGSYNQHTGRQAVRDDSLLTQDETGAWVDADLQDDRPRPDQQVEMVETLRVIGLALREAIPSCAGEQVALANDVINQRILIDVAQSAASIAAKHKVTSATVYKVETALRGALAANL